jgi:protoheme IX farnesyltransferase
VSSKSCRVKNTLVLPQAKCELSVNAASVFDYFMLLKPRVMVLVIFTSFCGYMLAPYSVHPFLAFVGILSIALSAGASGGLNQWYEAKTDRMMIRTKNRPVASNRIAKEEAFNFGVALSALSLILMQITFGFFQCLFLAFTIFYYVYFYTVILKPNTDQNIVIGGAAGAFPPMIGYSLASPIDVFSVCLFLIIFLWTPAHFWALSFSLTDDYKQANIPIVLNTRGVHYTVKAIYIYAILTTVVSFIPLILRDASIITWCGVGIVNAIWLYYATALFVNIGKAKAMKLFFYSIFYLFALFLIFTLSL